MLNWIFPVWFRRNTSSNMLLFHLFPESVWIISLVCQQCFHIVSSHQRWGNFNVGNIFAWQQKIHGKPLLIAQKVNFSCNSSSTSPKLSWRVISPHKLCVFPWQDLCNQYASWKRLFRASPAFLPYQPLRHRHRRSQGTLHLHPHLSPPWAVSGPTRPAWHPAWTPPTCRDLHLTWPQGTASGLPCHPQVLAPPRSGCYVQPRRLFPRPVGKWPGWPQRASVYLQHAWCEVLSKNWTDVIGLMSDKGQRNGTQIVSSGGRIEG